MNWSSSLRSNSPTNSESKRCSAIVARDLKCPTSAGGASQQQISSGTGSVAFTPALGSSTSLALYAGLANVISTPPATAELDYGFTFWANGGWDVRESGTYQIEGSFSAGELAFSGESEFSRIDPGVIYGVAAGGNSRTIKRFNFSTLAYTTVLDLDTTVSGLTGYVGSILTGGSGPEKMLAFYGGGQQDLHYYALWVPIGNLGARKLVNTQTSAVNGVQTNIPLNFRLHSTAIDKSGRYVFLHPRVPDRQAPRNASPVYAWDTATNLFTAVTSGGADGSPAMLSGGHDSVGHGVWANMDCCTSTSWDAAQWQFRSISALGATRDLITPVLTPKEVFLSDHSTWNHAQVDRLVPFISSTFRYGNNTVAWRAWDDEIIAVQTDVPVGSGATVWRFAHHRSNVAHDTDPAIAYFWYQPIANVSPNGRWAIFTSNWEKTLGIDTSEGHYRRDVFVIELAAGSGGPGPTPADVAWINTAKATAEGSTLRKTSGCTTCADAGDVSQQEITAGNGSIEFTSSVGHRFVAGLGRNRTVDTSWASIDFAFSFWTNSTWDIRELGVYRAAGTYVAGDVFKIAVDAGVVRYYQNGTLVYTRTSAPVYPLGFDTSLFTVGSTVSGAKLMR